MITSTLGGFFRQLTNACPYPQNAKVQSISQPGGHSALIFLTVDDSTPTAIDAVSILMDFVPILQNGSDFCQWLCLWMARSPSTLVWLMDATRTERQFVSGTLTTVLLR